MPTVAVTTRSSASLAVDALVVGAVPSTRGPVLAPGHGLPDGAADHLTGALQAADATGDAGEVTRVYAVPGTAASSVLIVGLGSTNDPNTIRAAAGTALRALAKKKTVAVALPTPDVAAVTAVADGAYAGCYTYVKPAPVGAKAAAVPAGPRIQVVSGAGQGKAVKSAVERAAVIGAARDLARDLVNTPPNMLFPQSFADIVKATAAASPAKVSVSVLDDKALIKGGFGGIVGVGQGSSRPPRIVTISYRPARAQAAIALVGKGITFDSGGLCIKPPAGMLTMKCDMAGAAAVAGAVLALAELGGPVAVTGYLCLAENMPSGTAQRPSDVVTMRNKTTVEILDTDAEGRMVLADGICLAAEAGPDAIVDIATLTGAQMVALGPEVAGVMGNTDAFRGRVVDAVAQAGEHAWPMPLPEALRKGLESPTADIAHKSDRNGGMLTAGLFLRHFVPEGVPWAHIDMAGPAFNDATAKGTTPKGGTGWGVASLVALVESYGH
ncbi:MAG: leucyl aminopeptidase [Phycicoccus sp.]|nr:leucyl aminopeptidase [Phycicoccus sp.]